jgi:hypothetical protein
MAFLWWLVVPLLVLELYLLLLPWLERNEPPLDCNRGCPFNGRSRKQGDDDQRRGQL